MKTSLKGAVLIPRHGEISVQISAQELQYFRGGRLALFRIWRRACLQKLEMSFGYPVKFEGYKVQRGPALAVPFWLITVKAVEIIPPPKRGPR